MSCHRVGLSEHEPFLWGGNSALTEEYCPFLSFIHLGGAVSGQTTVLRGSQDCDLLHCQSSSVRILGVAEEAELGSEMWTTMGWFWWVPKEQSISGERINGLGRKKVMICYSPATSVRAGFSWLPLLFSAVVKGCGVFLLEYAQAFAEVKYGKKVMDFHMKLHNMDKRSRAYEWKGEIYFTATEITE